MEIYERTKKYLRFIIPAAIVIAAILVTDPGHQSKVAGPVYNGGAGNLQVSQSGAQIYTNVAADGLQSAAAPADSATTSGLSPQQAAPNYCSPGEVPLADGCITQ